MDAHARVPRVHLCRLSPRRDALDSYFAPDEIAMDAQPVWEMPEHYEVGDILVVVAAREPAVLNIEVLTSSSADGGRTTEDSAGAELGGVSIPGIDQRMAEPTPTAPATLDPDYAQRWMDAFHAERADPTPWYSRDTTGCADVPPDNLYLEDLWNSMCLGCNNESQDASGEESAVTLQVHLCNEEDADGLGIPWHPGLGVCVCSRCHDRLHEPDGPTVIERLYSRRPPCPQCGRHAAIRLIHGMPPGPPPPGTQATGCDVIDDEAENPDYQCNHCGHTWPAPQERSWSDMHDWLVESMTDKPVGFVLDLGPLHYGDYEDDQDVICAQVQVLDDGVLILRRSRIELGRLLLTNYSVAEAVLDRWYLDEHFDDCTDGYLFSRDIDMLAEMCVSWFQDNWGTEAWDDVGCSYRFPDTLLPSEDE